MSRCYEMSITVRQYRADRGDEIVEAVIGLGYDGENEEQLNGHHQTGRRRTAMLKTYKPVLQFQPESINIAAGHSDQEVAAEITHAIWAANGEFCDVAVSMRDLDADVPTYSLPESVYEEWEAKR